MIVLIWQEFLLLMLYSLKACSTHSNGFSIIKDLLYTKRHTWSVILIVLIW